MTLPNPLFLPQVGMLIAGRFLIEEFVGRGGMSIIARARDEHTGGFVALKLMNVGSVRDAEVKRFEREAQMLASLHHPALVS